MSNLAQKQSKGRYLKARQKYGCTRLETDGEIYSRKSALKTKQKKDPQTRNFSKAYSEKEKREQRKLRVQGKPNKSKLRKQLGNSYRKLLGEQELVQTHRLNSQEAQSHSGESKNFN